MSLTIAIALTLSLPSAANEVTFTGRAPVVGDTCASSNHGAIRLEGPRRLTDAFGTERGGDTFKELTTLEVKDGVITKLRVKYGRSTDYVVRGGRKAEELEAVANQTYVFTRLDAAGHFDATHEDGSAITGREREDLRSSLDRTEPELFTGRTMKLGEKVVFGPEDVKKYFPEHASSTLEMRGFEMTLGAIEKQGTAARVDLKFLFEASGVQGDASVKGWATYRMDLDQRHVTLSMEGPLRIAMEGPASGLGSSIPAGSKPRVDPQFLTGTFQMDAKEDCAQPTP